MFDFSVHRARAAALCRTTFGQPVTYNGQPVTAIFRAPSLHVAAGLQAGVSTDSPTLTVIPGDLPAPPVQGDQVVIDGDRYEVADPQPAGGRVVCVLVKLPDDG